MFGRTTWLTKHLYNVLLYMLLNVHNIFTFTIYKCSKHRLIKSNNEEKKRSSDLNMQWTLFSRKDKFIFILCRLEYLQKHHDLFIE